MAREACACRDEDLGYHQRLYEDLAGSRDCRVLFALKLPQAGTRCVELQKCSTMPKLKMQFCERCQSRYYLGLASACYCWAFGVGGCLGLYCFGQEGAEALRRSLHLILSSSFTNVRCCK